MDSRPNFLLEPQDTCNINTKTPAINPEGVHLKQIVLQTDMSIQEKHASTWSKMARIIALMMLFVKNLSSKIKQRKIVTLDEGTTTLITTTIIQEINEIGAAETCLKRI